MPAFPAKGPCHAQPRRNARAGLQLLRRPLSEEKKKRLLTLLAIGCSRRRAAAVVGCSPSTIARYAVRDPEFRQQLADAEQLVELHALRAIRTAFHNPRYWRAAAWSLERMSPDRFGKRPPLILTTEHLRKLFAAIFRSSEEAVPEGKWDIILDKFDVICEEQQTDHDMVDVQPLPNPDSIRYLKTPKSPALPSFPVEHPTDDLDEFTDFEDDATTDDASTSDDSNERKI